MQVANNIAVSIHYTLKNSDGEVLDSSEQGGPLHYLHGAGNIIPGLENELTGKKEGDKLSLTIEPEQAYGIRRQELVQNLPLGHFQGIDDLQVGMRLRAQSEAGEQLITIVDIQNDEVTVDANHPLAGETLHFDVEIVALREATETEIEHGHIHHGDAHHH